jgi:predicted DCC family thiol-disulfide oxidoreductase YuxK
VSRLTETRLAAPVAYLTDLGRSTVAGWNRFWFTPADPTPLGLVRIGIGLLLVWNFAILGLDLHAVLGQNAWADPDTVRNLFSLDPDGPNRPMQPPLSWSVWLMLPDSLLLPAYVLSLVALVCFTLGLFSRTTAAIAWILVVSTAKRSPVTVFGFDQTASMLCLYLAATGSSGQALSLDRFIARWRSIRSELSQRRRSGKPLAGSVPDGTPRPTVSANLSLRLIQIHLCLMYAMSGLSKLQSPNWWNGSAFAQLLGYSEFRPLDLTWLAAYPHLLMTLTHAAVALEIGYAALIWVRPLRPLILALTIGLHLGIMIMMGLYEFAGAMIAANLAFVSGPWVRGFLFGGKASEEAISTRVLFDGACPKCRASVALLGAADPATRIEWIDLTVTDLKSIHPALTREACIRAMHAVLPNKSVLVGYDAVTAVMSRAPLFWAPALIASLPGVSTLGRRAYNSFAATRPRDQPCTDDVCAVPARPASSRKARRGSPKP